MINWIKKLFKKVEFEYTFINIKKPIHEVLTDKQYDSALSWYKKHKSHVLNLVKNSVNSFPPTLQEDKNDCKLWKSEYWKWFIESIKMKNNEK